MGDAVLAVDLGGTTMRAALVAADGQVLLRRSQPTPRQDTCPDALLGLVGGVLADHPVRAAVVGVPGRIDHRAGALEYAPNLPPHWPAALREDLLADHLGMPGSGAALSELVRAGHRPATEVWNEVVTIVAAAVVNAAHLFAPEVVILGGGMGRGPQLIAPVRARLHRDGPRALDPPIEVRPAALGDDAGLAGAAGWARVTGPSPPAAVVDHLGAA